MSFLFRKTSKPRIAIDDVFRFITNNVILLLVVYVGSWFLGAFLISWIEGWRLLDGLWWANVASLTIGYGDLAPKTDLGRIVAMMFHYIWALYLILCIAAHLVKYLFKDRNEMTHEEQEWLFNRTQQLFEMQIANAKNQKAIAKAIGNVSLDLTPFVNPDGTFKACPPQPTDTSYGDIVYTEAAADATSVSA